MVTTAGLTFCTRSAKPGSACAAGRPTSIGAVGSAVVCAKAGAICQTPRPDTAVAASSATAKAGRRKRELRFGMVVSLVKIERPSSMA